MGNIKTVLLYSISLFFKIKTCFYLFFFKKNILPLNNAPRLIVSLTSYGRRVRKSAPYTIVSILKQQNVIIDKIILSLDKNTWCLENLPWSIKKLSQLGVEIRFVDDIGSYIKLLPVLSIYESSVIVTVDDDIYYSNNLIKRLYDEHLVYPNSIISGRAKVPNIIGERIISSYKYWTTAKVNYNYSYILPLGYSGVLYPPNSLSAEVFNRNVFLKLAPSADDLWFWIMGIKNGSKTRVINDTTLVYYPIDLLYQITHKNAALSDINVKMCKNDNQLKSLIDYYGISF